MNISDSWLACKIVYTLDCVCILYGTFLLKQWASGIIVVLW